MNDNVLYELVVEKNHIDLIIKALSNYMCAQYEGIDLEVVDVPKTVENIKIAADMQSVLKHQLGTTRHTPKQTSETTGLIWCKEAFAPQETLQHKQDDIDFEEMNKRLEVAFNKIFKQHNKLFKRMSDM